MILWSGRRAGRTGGREDVDLLEESGCGTKVVVKKLDTSVVEVRSLGMSDSAPCDPLDDDDDASDVHGPSCPSAASRCPDDWSGTSAMIIITLSLSSADASAPRSCIAGRCPVDLCLSCRECFVFF